MNKKISLGTSLVITLLAVLVCFEMTYLYANNKITEKFNSLSVWQKMYEKLDVVDSTVRDLYVGEIDDDNLTDGLIYGYIYGIGDKYASYYTAEQYAEVIAGLEGTGVGIGLRVIYNKEYSAIEILTVIKDSPAMEAGMLPGDMIIAIDNSAIGDIGYDAAVNSVKGDEGTTLSLTVLRGVDYSERLTFDVERRNIAYNSVESRMYDGNIGIIEIMEFNSSTPSEFKTAITTLMDAGASEFVFDVRNNPGGEYNSICEVLDYLLPEGPIIRTTDNTGKETVRNSDASCITAPMAVLMNAQTASAGELFVSAIRDYNSGALVGTVTYGKGTVQRLVQFADGSGLRISTSMYCPPYGDNFEGIGVSPDIEVALSEEQMANFYKLSDEDDPQLQAAVSYLKAQLTDEPQITDESQVTDENTVVTAE